MASHRASASQVLKRGTAVQADRSSAVSSRDQRSVVDWIATNRAVLRRRSNGHYSLTRITLVRASDSAVTHRQQATETRSELGKLWAPIGLTPVRRTGRFFRCRLQPIRAEPGGVGSRRKRQFSDVDLTFSEAQNHRRKV